METKKRSVLAGRSPSRWRLRRRGAATAAAAGGGRRHHREPGHAQPRRHGALQAAVLGGSGSVTGEEAVGGAALALAGRA